MSEPTHPLDPSPQKAPLGIALPVTAEQEKTSPEALIAALLSEASYVGKSKAFGWSGIAAESRLSKERSEAMRQELASGQPLKEDQAEALRQSFWRDDLMMLTLDEIKDGRDSANGREALARRLFVALFTEPASPFRVESQLLRATRANPASANVERDPSHGAMGSLSSDVGFTRPGVFRATDVHCVIYAKVWTPEDGLSDENKTVWVAARGTENNANALQKPIRTFLFDYAFKAYRNFAKTYKARYKDSMDAFLLASDMRPDLHRPERMVFCGHSLGGSEAIEAVIQGKDDFQKRGIATAGYTFGSPGTGKVGALSAAAAIPGIAMLGLAHAGAALLERVPGMQADPNPMAIKASKLSRFSRLARLACCKLAIGITWLPVIGAINRMSVIASNAADALAQWNPRAPIDSVNTGMLGLGWRGWREPGAERWAEQEGGMTHYAHKRDFIRLAGECAGFDLPGKTELLDTRQAVGTPTKEHSATLYVHSIQDLLTREGDSSHAWMQALSGCRKAVDQMMNKTALLHQRSVESGVEAGFIKQQLKSCQSLDQNEAPEWLRQSLARDSRDLTLLTTKVRARFDRDQSAARAGSHREAPSQEAPRSDGLTWLPEPVAPAATIPGVPKVFGLSVKAHADYEAPGVAAARSRSAVFGSPAWLQANAEKRETEAAKKMASLAFIDSMAEKAAERLCAGRFKLTLAVDNTRPPPSILADMQGPLIGQEELIREFQRIDEIQRAQSVAPDSLSPGGFGERLLRARALKNLQPAPFSRHGNISAIG